jgi:hypothetical protein
MSLCALCGHQTFGGELCHYHDTNRSVIEGERWAAGNRIMCDFIHRGIVPERSSDNSGSLPEIELADLRFGAPQGSAVEDDTRAMAA